MLQRYTDGCIDILSEELRKLDGESVGLNLLKGLFCFAGVNTTNYANSFKLPAECIVRPFGNYDAIPRHLLHITQQQRAIENNVTHYEELKNHEPKRHSLITLDKDVDEGFESQRTIFLKTTQDEVHSIFTTDKKRNLLDMIYFDHNRIIAFPVHLLGSPVMTCYLDVHDENIFGKTKKIAEILEKVYWEIGPALTGWLQTNVFTALTKEAVTILRSDGISTSQAIEKFLFCIPTLLCAKQININGEKYSSDVFSKYKCGTTLNLSSGSREYSINLPCFKYVDRAKNGSGVINSHALPGVELSKRQTERLLNSLIELIETAKQREDQLCMASNVWQEIRNVKDYFIDLERHLLPSVRTQNRFYINNLRSLLDNSNLDMEPLIEVLNCGVSSDGAGDMGHVLQNCMDELKIPEASNIVKYIQKGFELAKDESKFCHGFEGFLHLVSNCCYRKDDTDYPIIFLYRGGPAKGLKKLIVKKETCAPQEIEVTINLKEAFHIPMSLFLLLLGSIIHACETLQTKVEWEICPEGENEIKNIFTFETKRNKELIFNSPIDAIKDMRNQYIQDIGEKKDKFRYWLMIIDDSFKITGGEFKDNTIELKVNR